MNIEKRKRWRLILGKEADPNEDVSLSETMSGMDEVLNALYDDEQDRGGGLGKSSPKINRWLGDIRKYFPKSVVQIMQKDAIERLGLNQLLLEPELLEMIEPDVNLVSTLLTLNKIMPERTKETARMVVRKVVLDLEKKLHNPMREAVEGSISRSVRNRRPKHNEIDWNKTIQANLKHYQKDLQTIIPETLIGYGRQKGKIARTIILLVDQSGSMANSVVYSAVFGAVLASMRSIKTHIVMFDTSVVDLTENLNDPVDILFGTQLGGGTDINQALAYAEKLIQRPSDTILVLISDLYEGGNERQMLKTTLRIKQSGATFITLLALSNEGAPLFDKNIASKYAAIDIPSFACTPDQFPDLMATAIKKESLSKWISKKGL